MSAEKFYQLALTLIPGIGHVTIKTLISYVGAAEEVFSLRKSRLLKIPGIGSITADAILGQDVLQRAEEQMKMAQEQDVKLLFYTDADYPRRLKQIYDAPSLIYFKGEGNLNTSRVLAIVGTRQATAYGKLFIENLVEDLKQHDILIVSGLAYGIDVAAHKASLANGLPTVGVMATGVDIIYPAVHRKYADRMLASGGLLSEYPLGTRPDPARFPARNRIIAGLADATLVVEAAEKGGALITADLASGYDREVLALPGDVTKPTSAGTNNLIKKNVAQMITSAKDLSFYLQWDKVEEGLPEFSALQRDTFEAEEWDVINTLEQNGRVLHIDELSWKSQKQVSALAGILLNLEFKGAINSLPGKKFALK